MLDPKLRILNKLNTFALITILSGSAVGLVLNYCFRMAGEPGGMYSIYILCGVTCCLIYPYVHEFAHALAIVLVKRHVPAVKFGKLAAWCGSPDIVFTKAQYVFAASFPFLFYSALLIPFCVLLPPLYFPIPFMPLTYNLFGSVADAFMLRKALTAPRGGIIVDGGTEIVIYGPVQNM